MARKGNAKAAAAALKQLVVSSIMLAIQFGIFFFSAGYIGFRPWIYFSSSFVHYTVSIVAQYKLNLNWAMAVNPFFESTVRIQKDRDYKVITSGSYRLVRHPGYLSGLLFVFAFPLIVGSVFAFVVSGIYLILILLRTLLEDRTLCRELAGYAEYSRKVGYRLLPLIW